MDLDGLSLLNVLHGGFEVTLDANQHASDETYIPLAPTPKKGPFLLKCMLELAAHLLQRFPHAEPVQAFASISLLHTDWQVHPCSMCCCFACWHLHSLATPEHCCLHLLVLVLVLLPALLLPTLRSPLHAGQVLVMQLLLCSTTCCQHSSRAGGLACSHLPVWLLMPSPMPSPLVDL